MNTTSMSEILVPEIPALERHIVFRIILSVEGCAAFILNVLFLLSYLRIKNNVSNMYIIMSSLSVADILAGVLYSTNFVDAVLAGYDNIEVKYQICQFRFFLGVLSLHCNVLHLLLMATDRLIAISLPYR